MIFAFLLLLLFQDPSPLVNLIGPDDYIIIIDTKSGKTTYKRRLQELGDTSLLYATDNPRVVSTSPGPREQSIAFPNPFYSSQDPWTCLSAAGHAHDDITEAEMVVTSWEGCNLNGSINGNPITIFADCECDFRSEMPGVLKVKYDRTCRQIIEAEFVSSGLPPFNSFGRFTIPRTQNVSDPVEIRNFLNGPEIGGAGFNQCYVVVNVTVFRCLRTDESPYEWKDWPWINGNAERDALTRQIRQEGYGNIFGWMGRLWASKPRQ